MIGAYSSNYDNDENFESLFEDGHWEWDENVMQLVFTSDRPRRESSYESTLQTTFGPVEFKDNLDLLDELRFRKLFQRKTVETDVVTVQDIKDLVLYTAPLKMLISAPATVNVLHLRATHRFLRALIFYCQYYLQTSDEMSKRSLELEAKIRTHRSDEIERIFQINLEDLRLLVAKEYCNLIMGDGEFKKYHHMGLSKKTRSLTKKEAHLFENVLRIAIQITWIALGRKAFNQIEKEVHRIFKTPIFNFADHRLNSMNTEKLSNEEQKILLGHCVHYGKKIKTQSPLANEAFCSRHIDFRMFGLGIIKYNGLPSRLRYFEQMLIAPEILLSKFEISLGIVGLPRSNFDTMLREIKVPLSGASTSSSRVRQSVGRLTSSRMSRSSAGGKQKSTTSATMQPLYKDIVIPEPSNTDSSAEFSCETLPTAPCDQDQQNKWLRWIKLHTNRKNKHKKH
ncbi:uncharacterized protein LOC101741872 [Bombyx mori]|uniref:Uncharacterized protein n=1 Tax=Bombyx mori TaxID=7091 RepID=A0A8R2HQL8_BOMMO|nr:uncharacterized protein LOC101741872 isoform X1 [Bombyx mori]